MLSPFTCGSESHTGGTQYIIGRMTPDPTRSVYRTELVRLALAAHPEIE